PDHIVLLPPRALPKTTSGKLRRRPTARAWLSGTLPVLSAHTPPSPSPSQPEGAPLLRWLLDRIGGHADATFAEIGLDSAALLELSGDLAAHLAAEVDPALFWEHPTPRALATALAGASPLPILKAPQHSTEPVLVVGCAARLPGASDITALWSLLCGSEDAITDVPPSRWRGAPTRGGFVSGIEGFDADLFGMAEREVLSLDPQQRLLLEGVWRALEDASIDPAALHGSDTGVFVGIGPSDYGRRSLQRAELDGWALTGSAPSVAAGRIAHRLGLEGPAMSIDTACSSSLVAAHLALRALRAGECTLAIVAGVQVNLDPEVGAALSALGALSKQGRCASFGAAADGYVRSEGCVVMIFARADAAAQCGLPERARLLGSAVRHDGQSNGLTAPSGTSQAATIRAALTDANLSPSEIDAIEAHGTGTPLGDPVELRALARAFAGRTRPLPVGTAKSHLGHTEAAAGLVGLLKATLSIQHGHLPALLDAADPTPRFPWGSSGIVPANNQPSPRCIGVSSFGLSGTNAHVIVAAPTNEVEEAPAPDWIFLSAATDDALQAQAAQLHTHPLTSTVRRGVSAGRALLPHRAAWRPSTLGGRPAHSGMAPRGGSPPAVSVLCAGQGTLRPGIARQLHGELPVFRAALDGLLSAAGLAEVRAALLGEAPITDTRIAQPATVALGLALAAQWQAWGLRPTAALGHSAGEITAAAIMGAISPSEALAFAAHRGAAMADLGAPSAMVSIHAEREQWDALLPPGLTIAVHNADDRWVVSGPLEPTSALEEALRAAGIAHRRLPVSHGFHSDAIYPALDRIAAAAPTGSAQPGLISGTTAAALTAVDAAHWRRQASEPVRFAEALRALPPGHVIELGAPGTIAPLVRGVVGLEAAMGRGPLSAAALHDAAMPLLVAGVTLDRSRIWGPGPRTAPTRHPFQRRRFWISRPTAGSPPTAEVEPHAVESLVHVIEPDPAGGWVWRPAPAGPPWLREGARCLITGGFGGLGRALARHLRERHGARLVLVSRRLDAERQAFADALGAEAHGIDLAQPGAAAVLAGAPFDMVFHLAGSVDSADAMSSKRDTLLALEAHVEALGWVLFSSISGVIPGLSRGIEAYAEANRWLDAHARARRVSGARVTAIAFGPWSGDGLAAGAESMLAAAGLAPMSPARALAAMERALQADAPNVAVVGRGHEPGTAEAALPDDLAEQLRVIIAQAARREPSLVGDDDTLTELGVDSVAALDVVKDIEALVGWGLPTTFAYEHDSISAMLRGLRGGAARTDGGEAPVVSQDVVRLLPGQQTFVVQRRFFPDMPGNVFLAVRVEPGLEQAPLTAAVATVVERHPSLGAVIRREGPHWSQHLGAVQPVLEWVRRVDLETIRDDVFDLEAGPLWRAVSDGSWLALTGHHSTLDAWSQRNVLEDIMAAYLALRDGGSPELPPLEAGWPEAAALLRRGDRAGLSWWQERLSGGVPPIHLPWTAPVEEPSSGGSHAHRICLSAEETAAAQERAKSGGVSLPGLLLAAYMQTLCDQSGQHDVTVRVAHARRELRLPDVDRIVGSFADSLPIRGLLQVDEPLMVLAQRLQQELAHAAAHAAASSMALAALQGRSAAGPVGITPAGFSFPLLPSESAWGDLRLSDVHGASASGFSRIGLIAWIFDGRLHVTVTAARSHLSIAQVSTVGQQTLAHLTSSPPPLPATL
ncbi:MAG: acyl transferase domain-containing protein, partial [Myxococcota bacterium]